MILYCWFSFQIKTNQELSQTDLTRQVIYINDIKGTSNKLPKMENTMKSLILYVVIQKYEPNMEKKKSTFKK